MVDLLAFWFAVFVMYWSLPIGCLLYRIRFFHIRGKRDDIFRWAEVLVHFFRVRMYHVGNESLYRSQTPVIYLCNHRSWADFFLDTFITEAEASPLSRWAVFPAFPIFLTSALCLRAVIFFKRAKVADKELFNRTLEKKVLSSFTHGLIVYPEGHRNLETTSLPLKRGMLHFAHSRKWPVQLIITQGKEQLLSEKRLRSAFYCRLKCGMAPVIQSADFETFESFTSKVQQEWDALWAQVYNSPLENLPELQVGVDGVRGVTYPTYILVGQALICFASVLLFLGTLWFAVRLAVSSSASMALAGVLVGLTAISLHRACRRQSASEQEQHLKSKAG
jgi:1-acyl-sn-glycerol-3-phosphate acyltransferase